MRRALRRSAWMALAVLALTPAAPLARAAAQEPLPRVADTIRLEAGAPGAVPSPGGGSPGIALRDAGAGTPFRGMKAGEQVAVWLEGGVRVGDPSGPGPVPDAAVGDVIAQFGGSGWFAWPEGRLVWTAPRAGVLAFGLNGWPSHGLEGAVDLVLVALGTAGSPGRRAFPLPSISLRRAPGGVRVRYADRAGFGLDRKTLRFTLRTAHGTTYYLGSWVPPGDGETTLPLPPPGLPLPAGIHTLTATITDHLGNDAPPDRIDFDAAP